MKKETVPKFISILLALGIWQFLAILVGTDMLLASPVQVIVRLLTLLGEPDFLSTVAFSFGRIALGFLLAFLLGTGLGLLAGRVRAAELFLWPYVIAVRTVPAASFIILCLMWMDFRRLTVLIAFLIAFPAIYSNVLQGIRSTDPKMAELAEVYRVPWERRLLYIDLPAVKPYLLSAVSVSSGMAWKAGIAAEVIGLVEGSIGDRLYEAKIYFQNGDLLAWTLVVILLSVLSEKFFSVLLRGAFREVEKL